MFQKRIEVHNINDNKSFSIYNDKSNSSISNLKLKYNPNYISPKKPLLIASKSQTNILLASKKHIKISFNKYHQYIKNIEANKNNENNRPLSLHFNKKINKNILINNNRGEIQNDYSIMAKQKSFYDKYTSNSISQTNRTMFLNYNNYNLNPRQRRLNKLNIGINSQSTKNSSLMVNYKSNNYNNDDTSLFTKLQNSNTTATYNKNTAPLTLKKLKNSKFFYKTKYVTGFKNKNIKNIKNSSLSTYNISFNPDEKNEALYNTINAIIKNKLINKMKITESEESHNNIIKSKLNMNKKSLKSNNLDNIEKAQYLDFLPVLLNHMRQKQIMDDIYGEYNIYLSNISKSTFNSNSANKKNNNLEINKFPKIKYLFLENVINNLKHMVKFINVKNNEELEQNVINIIRNEYSKLKQENNEIEDLKDFLTYGYEYIPKHILYNKLPSLEERGLQTSKLFYNSNNNKNSNKQRIFFVNELKEKNQISLRDNSHEKISSMKNIYVNHGLVSKKKSFAKMEIKSRNNNNELREDLNSIFSSYNINDQKQKTLDSFKIKSNKSKEKEKGKKNKPKFVKINLKGNKINENINDISSIKLNSSDNKINETLFPSTIGQKETTKEKMESNKETNEEKVVDNQNKEIKEQKEEKKEEKINENINNVPPPPPEEKKENNITNVAIPENKETNKENVNNDNNDDNNKQNEINIKDNKDINTVINNQEIQKDEPQKEEEKKDGNVNNINNIKEKEEDSKSNISEKSKEEEEKKLKEEEEKKAKEEEEKKDILEEEEELLESNKNSKKHKKAHLKKKKIDKFLEGIENTLIALNQIRKHAKKKSNKYKPIYNELMYHHRNPNDDNENDEEDEEESQIHSELNNSENKEQSEVMKNSLENKDLEEKEITVSSLSNNSIESEPEEFVKLKKTILTKTKKQAFDEEKRKNYYRRRDALINPSIEVFKQAVKSQKMVELNNKMKKIYDDIHKEKKREENKGRKRKIYMFSFTGVDPSNIDEIEKRKKVNLNRLKEDIKYKILQGKYHVVELDNFQNFSRAVMAINFSKYKNNLKKLSEFMHSMEKYFQLFYNELINREKQNNDEKRINKFLVNLKEEVGETIPYVTNYKGKFCRSTDLNKEGDLSILNSP